ncbi:MAG: hypothetical protein KA120_00605 [Candidatus Goldbacteria bacterium]|nr:hypothetical protein [Candidatus Goldiibacteriota bacterium]
MKNRDKRLSVRTTKKVEELLKSTLKRKEYKFYSKSDIINLVLEDTLPGYAEGKTTAGKNNDR